MLDQNHLRKKFARVREQTEKITSRLEKEDHVSQPVTDVSPPKWHLAHTTWFFEAFVLQSFKSDYREFHPRYFYLFNSYYKGVGKMWPRERRGWITRPTVEDILQYRKYVNEQFYELLEQHQGESSRLQYLIELGINHEQQHQELLMYDIKYILGHNPIYPAYFQHHVVTPSENAENAEWLDINCGAVEVGQEGDHFYFDNETARHRIYLPPYQIMNRPVNNREFLEFMEAGGYNNFEYWLDDGWSWVTENQISHPEYWIKFNKGWYEYHLDGLQPLAPEAPVTHISFYEADAFARWKGLRLPTEEEWEVACNIFSPNIPEEANLSEKEIYRPLPADHYQFFGDVWEWTGSAYRPYPGFNKEKGAVGEYNGKFMINQMVLRGGSSATARDHIRSTYRNFFYPQKRWMFSGFRLAK